jgi:class 3 adenylate cyclase/tetratricopeptide (TPR) repeat protein
MAVCPNCGEDNPERAKFCLECATPLKTEPAPPQEARKTVTVLFCDLIGSTALGERLDSESLREVMDRYFTEMKRVVERHGGIVEKYIGDAVMAVFGLPRAHEDDALRAVRAAFEMTQSLATLNSELERHWDVTLATRTGINTGEVVVGDPNSGQRLATGDTVNVAARLEQAAAPGTVLIGEPTYRLVRDAVEVEVIESLAFKGKSERLPAFRLLEVKRGARGISRRLDAPLVGRETEVAALINAFEGAAKERSCHLVTVLGEAGVGKSRLVAEVVDRLGARARVLGGRCLSYGEGITFWPLAEIVKEAADVGDEDSPAVARSKIATMLTGEEEGTAISERLASVIGLVTTSFPIGETFWASRKALEGLARDRPLVVVLEDIHWAEETFLDLVEHVAEYSEDASMLFVCSARRELMELRPEWVQTKASATSISLEPLSQDESEVLVHNLLGASGLSADARSRLTGTSQGNPLFVEQIISMWREDGTLSHKDGGWLLAADLETIAIPPTISALLSARLDRLLPEERTVIAAASVAGQVFHLEAVQELSPPTLVPQVPASLAALTASEFIRPDVSGFVDEEGYAFSHVLIRDAAYEGILKRTRAQLHERFATWLVRTAGERVNEYEEIVGYHLEQAYRYSTELGMLTQRDQRLAERASEFLSSAGKQAFLSTDMSSALNLLGRAASLLPKENSERGQLLLMVGTALSHVGQLEDAQHVLSEVIEDAVANGDKGLEYAALMERLILREWETGQEGDLVSVIHEAIPFFERTNDGSGLARAFKWLSEVHNGREMMTARREALETALVHARKVQDKTQQVEIFTYLPAALAYSPIPVHEGIRRCREIVQDVEPLGRSLRATAVGALAFLLAQQGDFDEARRLLAESKATMGELNLPWMAARLSESSGLVELLAENPELAENDLREGCEAFANMGENDRAGGLAVLLAEALYRQGEYEEAEHCLRSTSLFEDAATLTVMAKILARRESHHEAKEMAHRAVALYEGMDNPHHHAAALVNLGEVLCLGGHEREAARPIRQALRLYEHKGNIVSAAKAKKLLEQLRLNE